jgi:hypothetical protein
MAPGAEERPIGSASGHLTASLPVLREEDRVVYRSGCTRFDGFIVRQRDVDRPRLRIARTKSLKTVDKQFVATMLDTEAAIGHLRKKEFYKRNGFVIGKWRAYVSVKMTHKGDIIHLANLLGLQEPSKTELHYNTLKATKESAWCLQTSGITPCVAIRAVAPFLYNEKTKIEAQSIIRHGPLLFGERRHPLEDDGGVRAKRGVWIWPSLEKASLQTI